jgi:hypothetical protein
MQPPVRIQTFPLSSSQQKIPRCAPAYKQVSGLNRVKGVLRFLRFRLLNTWCIWHGTFRSFRGHIRTQSAKEPLLLTLGPAPLLYPDGSTREALGTLARSESIESLLARYRWVDTVDLRMFLEGFDAGESYARCRVDTETETHDA